MVGTALAASDKIAWLDISDLSQSVNGSVLAITVTNFMATIPAPVNITSASATSLAVGRLGATTPAFSVDSSTASQVAGLKVTGAATAGTVAVVVTDSGADANLTLNAKGAGTIGIGSVSTGRVTITPVVTITGALTQTGLATFNGGATIASGQTLTITGATVTGLTAASVGAGTFPAGAFVFQGALSGITTLAGTGAVSGFTTIVTTGRISNTVTTEQTRFAYDASNYLSTTIDSAGNAIYNLVGTGAPFGHIFRYNGNNLVNIGSNSSFSMSALAVTGVTSLSMGGALSGVTTLAGSGAISGFTSLALSAGISGVTTLSMSGALTYGGVTLTAAVTGTGSMVLSAGPTFTGTITAAGATFSSQATFTGSGTSIYLGNASNRGTVQFTNGAVADWAFYVGTSGDDKFYLQDVQQSAVAMQVTGGAAPAILFPGAVTVTGAFGCNAATARTAHASGGALNAYTTGVFGLNSDANMSALHALVVAIRAALVNNGIMS